MIDGQWYLLPDGERARAYENQIDGATRWRLDTVDGQPAYLFTDGRWHVLRYSPEDDAFRVLPCDLTTDDLTPECVS